MNRFLLILGLGVAVGPLGAQDAALEERINKLDGYVQDLLESQTRQQRRLEALAQDLRRLAEEQGRPNTNYITAEDFRRLAEKIQEVDKKREADRELILRELEKLAKAIKAAPVAAAPPTRPAPATPSPAAPEKGFEYVIQPGDTLSAIVQAYREQNIRVTTDQILKANPGLNPNRLRVGQKIFIPAPQP